jgi:hypothetical protein
MKPRLVTEKQASGLWIKKVDTPLPARGILTAQAGIAHWDFSKFQNAILGLRADTTLSITGVEEGDVGILLFNPNGFNLTLPINSVIPSTAVIPVAAGSYMLSFVYLLGMFAFNISDEYI